jgi:hypothetical protein
MTEEQQTVENQGRFNDAMWVSFNPISLNK